MTPRERVNARQRVIVAIAKGKIHRLPCEVCGDPKSQAHHDDYSKPLEVRWLCRAHHLIAHQPPKEMEPSELLAWRQSFNLLPEDAAHEIGISRRHYDRLEAGSHPIGKTIAKLVRFMADKGKLRLGKKQ